MRDGQDSRPIWSSGIVPGLCAVFGLLVASTGLLGWIYGIEGLKRIAPGMETMKPNTAMAFLAASSALFLLRREGAAPGRRRVAMAAAGVTLAIGVATLAEYLAGGDWGLSRLLVADGTRMSLSAAVGLTALGGALLGLDSLAGNGRRPTHMLALLAGLVGALACFGHVYGLQALHTMAAEKTLSLQSALVMSVLAFGVLISRSGTGSLHVLTSSGPGGAFARWLLPVVVFVPPGLDALRVIAERRGWVDEGMGVAAHTLTVMVLLGFFVWRQAAKADEADRRQMLFVEELREQERVARKQLEAKVRERTAELEAANAALVESTKMFEMAQRVAQIGSWSLNTATGAVRWSDELFRIFGLPVSPTPPTYAEQESLFGERSWMLLTRAIDNAVKQGTGYELELEVRRADGRECWAETRASPEFDEQGRVIFFSGTFRDVTEARRNREALMRREAELERSNRDLEQFAYVASHDLQEPLRAVSGCVQLLQRRHAEKLDAEARELMGHAVDGARRMQGLILDLLTYSRVGTAELSRRRVRLSEPLAEALKNLRVAIAESGALVTVEDELPEVVGDAPRLAMLLQNLVGNALKYVAPGRTPRVQVGARRNEASEWVVSVRDNGVGIEPRFFERIFVIFQRLHTREEHGGTGIGLALCKKIVERHGGRIWVESRPGEGSVFYFTLSDLSPP